MNSKSQNVSNPQFKAIPTATKAGLTAAAAAALEAVIFAENASKKQIAEYKPEDNFSNKSAQESAETMLRIIPQRDITAFNEMTDDNGDFLFDNKQMKKIKELCKEYPYEIKELADIKTKDGKRRFSGNGIIELVEPYSKEPFAVKKLAVIKNKKGEYILRAEEIKELIETYKEYPDAVRELANIEIMGKNRTYRCFSSNRICNLAKTYTQYPDGVKGLAALSRDIVYLDDDQINILAKAFQEHPEEVTELIKIKQEAEQHIFDKRFEEKCEDEKNAVWESIARLAEPYSKEKDGITEILNMKDPEDECLYRFDIKSICDIAEEYVKAPDFVRELVNMKIKGTEMYAFNAQGICQLAQKGPKYHEAIKNILTHIGNKSTPEVRSDRIDDRLLEAYKNYPQAVEKLAKMTRKDRDGKEENVFGNLRYVARIAEWYDKEPDIVQRIIDNDKRISDYFYYRSNIDDIIEKIKEAINNK